MARRNPAVGSNTVDHDVFMRSVDRDDEADAVQPILREMTPVLNNTAVRTSVRVICLLTRR